MIPIVEHFLSIEGEGKRAGKVCIFLRTAGCNLRCSFCDTLYSHDPNGSYKLTASDIVQKLESAYDCKTITVTGGEPLIHKEVYECLIPQLLEKNYDVNIETNGSVDLKCIKRKEHHKLTFTMDWKSISSGMADKMLISNLEVLTENDVLKFVVGSQEDLEQALKVIKDHKIKAQIYFSPVFGKIEMAEIVEFMKINKLYDAKLQCQLHKIVYDPNARGV